MTTAVAVYLVILSLAICVVMMRDHVTRRVELLSVRNFGLLGFIVFQLTSASIGLITPNPYRFPLTDAVATASDYAARCTLFLIVLLAVYRWGIGVRKAARMLPTTRAVPSDSFMLAVAVVLMFLTFALKFGVRVPLVGTLANYVGTAFAAIACGLAGWVWAKRFLNPVAAMYAMFILAGSSAAVVYGAFGRRGLLAVGCGLLWGMYYSRWRHSDPKRILFQMAVVAIVPAIMLALYTSARSSREHNRSVMQHIEAIARDGDLLYGVTLLLEGQSTGPTAMWIVENFPDNYTYRWFATPLYFFEYPVPRAIWPGKPMPISTQVARWGNIRGVDYDKFTIGPGIIGHASAEGGWIAVVVYGAMFGLFFRFFDEVVRVSPGSPFVVLPIGGALGQIIALSRGETSVFAFTYVFGVLGSYVSLIVIGKLLETIGLARPAPADSAMAEWTEAEDEWTDEWAAEDGRRDQDYQD